MKRNIFKRGYHFTETVIQNVEVGGVSRIRYFRQEGGREFMQGTPVQPSKEWMVPEITEAFPPQADFPLTDEPSNEGTSLVRNLRARRGELKILLGIKKKIL